MGHLSLAGDGRVDLERILLGRLNEAVQMTFWRAQQRWLIPHLSTLVTYCAWSAAGKDPDVCFLVAVAVGLFVGFVAYPLPECDHG